MKEGRDLGLAIDRRLEAQRELGVFGPQLADVEKISKQVEEVIPDASVFPLA